PAQLHGGADGAEPRPPARLRHRRRRAAGLDAAHLLPLVRLDGAALGDPAALRDDRQERLRPAQPAAARARRPRAGRELADRAGGQLMAPLGPLLAATPALPLGEGGKYVAGAYIVFVLLLLIYVGIMASKLQRIERDLREVAGIAEQRKADAEPAAAA